MFQFGNYIEIRKGKEEKKKEGYSIKSFKIKKSFAFYIYNL